MPLFIGIYFGKSKFQNSLFLHPSVLLTTSCVLVLEKVPEMYRANDVWALETRCHITQGSCLPGFGYRSHGVIRRQERHLIVHMQNLSISPSTFIYHIIPNRIIFHVKMSKTKLQSSLG